VEATGAYTIDELMSVCIARRIQEGDVAAQGIARRRCRLGLPAGQAGRMRPICGSRPPIGRESARTGRRWELARAEELCWEGAHGGGIRDGGRRPAAAPPSTGIPAAGPRSTPRATSTTWRLGSDSRRIPGCDSRGRGNPGLSVVYSRCTSNVPRHSRAVFRPQGRFRERPGPFGRTTAWQRPGLFS
jgi:hypothetical protein